jgi:hypothetical protein
MLAQVANSISKLLAGFVKFLSRPSGPRAYRPEKYYMRGPGPQWNAKHDRLAS